MQCVCDDGGGAGTRAEERDKLDLNKERDGASEAETGSTAVTRGHRPTRNRRLAKAGGCRRSFRP